ncbi:DUF4038 domain-containing protein [Sediminibacillus massiliensis]|uniref:apiosidase-like domain-containing protein n=1 Tax=Sediminibacillus massiliensis TaxID=1926277 RepID=UPI001FE7DF53|nr:DUF4038 domain-containing protein [Sediminibacillus massiliensis]
MYKLSSEDSRVLISESMDYFQRGDKRFFYLADTVWNAFLKCSLEEWKEYLLYRQKQNFNVLQISILPILHDASQYIGELQPFEKDKKGNWNFDLPNENYFYKAEQMIKIATEMRFIPALVVLWCNYVKGTWASEKVHPSCIMPIDKVESYTSYVVNRFKRYSPIYLASGDTNFPTDESVEYFRTVIRTIKRNDREGLTAFHLQPHVNLPEEFIHSKEVDFYMYQSGHQKNQDLTYKLAEKFSNIRVKRPIVNGEPCYEGHGYGREYGRFKSFEVRKAMWQSLLSGAKAGFTYGAHGLWSWHRRGEIFNNKEFSDTPLDWRSSLQLEGAWDVSFAKWLFELYNLFDLEPQDKILNESEEIRMASSKDGRKVIVYIPYLTEVHINEDLSNFNLYLVDLSKKNFMIPKMDFNNDKWSSLKIYDSNSDALLIGTRD